MKLTEDQYVALATGKKPKKKNRLKNRAKETYYDGMRFASKKECDRYKELELGVKGGIIKRLERQVPFDLIGADGEVMRHDSGRPLRYVADFVYFEKRRDVWVEVIEDAKGYRTEQYRLKAAIMRGMGKPIRET